MAINSAIILSTDNETTSICSESSSDIGKTVSQATSNDTGILLHYNNTTRDWWVRRSTSDDDFGLTL